jgi:hypothetical protein
MKKKNSRVDKILTEIYSKKYMYYVLRALDSNDCLDTNPKKRKSNNGIYRGKRWKDIKQYMETNYISIHDKTLNEHLKFLISKKVVTLNSDKGVNYYYLRMNFEREFQKNREINEVVGYLIGLRSEKPVNISKNLPTFSIFPKINTELKVGDFSDIITKVRKALEKNERDGAYIVIRVTKEDDKNQS